MKYGEMKGKQMEEQIVIEWECMDCGCHFTGDECTWSCPECESNVIEVAI